MGEDKLPVVIARLRSVVLRRYMDEAGLRQKDLVEMAGISQGGVYNVIGGRRASLGTSLRAVKGMGKTYSQFFLDLSVELRYLERFAEENDLPMCLDTVERAYSSKP